MKSMNAADITTQHDNLFKVWFCVFPKSIFTFRSSNLEQIVMLRGDVCGIHTFHCYY